MKVNNFIFLLKILQCFSLFQIVGENSAGGGGGNKSMELDIFCNYYKQTNLFLDQAFISIKNATVLPL